MPNLRAVPDEFDFEPEERGWVNHPDLPDDFYLATDSNSTDKHGHGETLYTKIPQDVKGHVARLVEDSRTPYRSTGDFYRHAIMHLIRDIEAHGEVTTTQRYTQHVKRILSTARSETRKIEILADEYMCKSAEQAIEEAMRTKNSAALRIAIAEARDVMDNAQSDVSSLARLVEGLDR